MMEDNDDSEFISKEHDILVNAVSKLDKTQHITEPTRSEPSIANSEFNLIKKSNKLDLTNVVKVLGETSTHLQISKKLRKSHDSSKVLPKPLEKPQAQRIKRATGYEDTKKKVARWDPVVARSRTADYSVFPLKPVETKLQPTNEFLSRFELKSALERELEVVDPPLHIEEEEEEKVYPMSYEEMVEHRQHIAKLRAQQSYKEAKAKRQSKIKSKKYHRVLKKERLKQQLKEFEELQKTNPEEALKKLEAIDKGRAIERHTLRHKNTGKWAKNKLIRAKYDKDVRQQLAEQLAVSRNLTHKTKNIESSDEETQDNDISIDMALSQDPMNPWMLKQSNKSNINTEFDFGYKKYLKEKMLKVKDLDESDTDDENIDKKDKNVAATDLLILKQSINKISQRPVQLDYDNGENMDAKSNPEKIVNTSNTLTEQSTNKSMIQKNHKEVLHKQVATKNKSKSSKEIKKRLVATSSWTVEEVDASKNKANKNKPVDITLAFDSLESKVSDKVEKKLNALRKHISKLEKITTKLQHKGKKRGAKDHDNLEYLKFKNTKQRAIIDEALTETGSKDIEKENDDVTPSRILNMALTNKQDPATSNIDPNRFIEIKPKYLNTALPQGENGIDLLDDDEQIVPKVNIEEIFEEDDVVASFRQEKEDEINKDKPEDIDLTLPGWGAWGGKGVKATKRKRNRLIMKKAPKMPRRDENKGDVIIKEFRDPKLSIHKVKEIPFPFERVKDYEASIRAPLGNTFIPEKAHKKLIRPSVITKAGAIIEPMDEDELLVKKNKTFNNKNVIKLLGQK